MIFLPIGGSSSEEVGAALFMYSTSPLLGVDSTGDKNDRIRRIQEGEEHLDILLLAMFLGQGKF